MVPEDHSASPWVCASTYVTPSVLMHNSHLGGFVLNGVVCMGIKSLRLDYLHAFLRIFISEYLMEFGLRNGVCFYHCFWTFWQCFFTTCLALEHFLYVMWTLDKKSSLFFRFFFGSEMPLGCHVWWRQEWGKGRGQCFFYDAEALLHMCFAVRDVPVFFIFATSYGWVFLQELHGKRWSRFLHFLMPRSHKFLNILISYAVFLHFLLFLSLTQSPVLFKSFMALEFCFHTLPS